MVTLTLMSCNQPSLVKTDLPIEVVSLKEAKKFDTILTINTDMRVFTFQNKKNIKVVIVNLMKKVQCLL